MSVSHRWSLVLLLIGSSMCAGAWGRTYPRVDGYPGKGPCIRDEDRQPAADGVLVMDWLETKGHIAGLAGEII